MSVGVSKSSVLTGTYQKVVSLYDSDETRKIFIGDGAANKVFLTFLTKAADIAWGETLPAIVGHSMGIGDSITLNGLAEIELAWVRNTVSADVCTIIITPFQVHE